jgi:acyl carrier protein
MPAVTMRQADPARPTRKALLAMFCETATEVVERPFENLSELTRIEDLVIDSLGLLEVIGSLERQLRIRLPDESLTGLYTICDLLDVVEKRFE